VYKWKSIRFKSPRWTGSTTTTLLPSFLPLLSLSLSLSPPPSDLAASVSPRRRSQRRGLGDRRRRGRNPPPPPPPPPVARSLDPVRLPRASPPAQFDPLRGRGRSSVGIGGIDGGAAGEGSGRLRLPHQAAPHRRQRYVAESAPSRSLSPRRALGDRSRAARARSGWVSPANLSSDSVGLLVWGEFGGGGIWVGVDRWGRFDQPTWCFALKLAWNSYPIRWIGLPYIFDVLVQDEPGVISCMHRQVADVPLRSYAEDPKLLQAHELWMLTVQELFFFPFLFVTLKLFIINVQLLMKMHNIHAVILIIDITAVRLLKIYV
jgi:hypothetical protein